MTGYPQPLALSVSDAAKRLGIGRNSAYEAIKRGELPHLKVGRRVLIPVAALERWLAAA